MDDNKKRLYDALSKDYDMGSFEQFSSDIQDSAKRQKLYDAIKEEYDLPDFDGFTNQLGIVQPQAEPKPYNPSEDTMGAGVGAAIGNAIANPQPQQTQPESQPKAQPAAKQGGYTPTWQEQMAMGITASQAGKTAKNAASGIDQQVQNQQTYQENAFSQTPEIGRQGHVVSDGEGYITDDATKHNVLVDANKQQQEADSYLEAMRKQREEYTEPTLWDTVSKSIGSGFVRVGTGLLNSMQQLAGGMIVEDASNPTGYTKTQSYDEQLRDKNNAITRGINSMHETADRLSRQAQPRNGKGFLDMLWDGDISGFLQKGVATAGESLPMTLSAFNPYTMVLNGISLAGNNYREQTLENPDIPEWKRFSMAVGSAAIEQAVEKYADPVFKYIGGGKILKKAGKEASEEITKEVTKKATENLAKRIYKGMGGLAKDAAGEGIEEVVTNFGNDALGEILDKLSRNDEYGLEAQWAKMRKENPNATLWDFAQQKAKENVESFIGGAMAGAYTSGTTQLTTKGIEYGLNHMLNEQQIVSNPNAQLNPASVDIAQSFDEGYTLDNEQDINNARAAYEEQRQRATEIFGEIRGLDEQPLKTIETMQQGGFTPEQIQAAYDYISAKATFDGVQQRMTEDTKRSRVDSYNISGNTIEELDSEGNVIGTHEYENQDEIKLGLFELQQTRANNDMQADISMMRLNPKYDYDTALASFSEETGVDPEYLESLVNTDPMERTEQQQAIVSEFAETIHNILYDNTTLHEDQSAEDGADLAEMMGIDLDDADGTQAQQITDSYNAATSALNELFARNEDLKQEVQSREQQGMPHQGIIASLDSFRPEDVQIVTDFYNQQAKFNGFLNRMSQKIGEEAANRRQRHTLNGTINGQADVRSVHTITDGTNTYYLVSGNITTDSSGRISDSDSGLIIGMDEDGNFVNIGDTNGYSVMPVTQSLDQWEEGERTRLQEEWTAKIDPTGSMMQPQPVPETAETGTQETESIPQTEGSVAQQPEPQQQVQIPIDEKSGLKRYEQGVPADQAIQDIQNDGFDVDEMADAYIAEAQEAIDKINKKEAKKPQDLIERKRQQGIIDYYNDVKARYAETNKPAESEENVNVQPNQPTVKEKAVSSQQNKTVEEQKQQRIAEAKAKYGELFDDDFTKANDVYELVSMWIGRGRSLNRDSVGQELGWNMGIGRDARYIETLLAKKGEGASINAFVHGVWESPENSVEGEKRFTTEEIREAVLDLLSSARSKSDVVDYALNTRIAQAEANLQEHQRREEDEMQEAGETIDDITPIDINWDEMPFAPATQEEIEEADSWFKTSNNTVYDKRTESGNDELADEYMPASGGEVSGVQEGETNSGQEQPDVSGSVGGNQSEESSETRGGETDNVRGSEGSLDVGSRTDRTASEVQGQVDEYLQPRNAEEEQIIANVIAQLQQEIGDAVEDANKARAELEKARAKESDRATDMFANDQTFAEPDAIFSQEEMGLDTSAEGVERRTAPQREKLQEATNKLNRLQSLEERNSRIRGALDNYRRQTSIDDTEREINKRHKEEYDKYIKPLLNRSDEELQQMAKKKEDAVNGDLKQLEGDLEYSAIHNVLLQREYDRLRDDAKNFIQNTIDDDDVTFVDKLTLMEFDKLHRLIDEQGVDDPGGKIENYVKRLRKKYPAAKTKEQPKTESRDAYLASHPLTEEQIMADTEATEDEKLNAIDFLKGEDDSAISRFYYDSIYERVQDQKPIDTEDPIEAIDEAARIFNKIAAATSARNKKRQEQKSQDQQDIDDALKEFNDFLDNAKGSNVLDKFMRKGLEGNDKAQASLLDAFTLTNEAQRMFLKDLLRLASKVGYAYIKSGIHDAQAWSKKMSESIGAKLKEVLGWDDAIIDEFVDEVWNQKYTVDGQRMRLSEHAERLNNGNVSDHAVNEHKQENNEAENTLSLQQEASEEKPKTKDGWLKKMNDVFKELCKKYGVPDDPIILNQWGGRYGFDYRITKGYRLDQFEPYYEAYKKKLDEPVEPASEKQLAFIDRLAEEGEKEMLHSIKLNKVSASYVISILKAAEDAVTSRYGNASMFEEYANELEKVAKLHGLEPKLEGDSAEFADRQKNIDNFRYAVSGALWDAVAQGEVRLKTMQSVKALAKEHGLEDLNITDLQEIVESEIVKLARNIAATDSYSDEQKFQNIVRLYNFQPTLSARDNDRINMQQYSTAAPMAYLMGRFADPDHKAKSGLEPSAGNGMLTIALPKEIMHVNDIDEMRLSNLAKQGFKEVTSQDGTQPFGEKQYDVVVTNPPFGNVTPKVFDGVYEISGLEHLMTINALESMKDDGRAAIIIGGNTDYNTNGTIKGKDRAFLNYLYAHYNVVDVINMDGKTLYSRQGTGVPVRMILINGRKEFNVKDFAPVQSKARAEQVKSYDELYKRVNDDILSDSNKPASVRNTESGKGRGVDDNANAGDTTQTGVRNVRPEGSSSQPQRGSQSGSSVQRSDSTANEQTKGQGSANVGGGLFDVGSRTEAPQSSGSAAAQADNGRAGGSERRDDTERPASQPDNSQRVGQRGAGNAQSDEQPAVKRGLGTEKVPYRKQSSNPFTLQSLMPAEQADVVKKALEDLGDVDQFLVDELGYSSKEELHQALAAEQIDSVSMAIHQMNQGSAFIIGDQTGIGKGRQAAALIRYGVKKGSFPVFITVKKALFSDMYRDLCDIGSPELRPFIWSADDTEHSGNVTDKDGNVVYQTPNAKEQKRVVDYINKNGKLPPEYDYVLTTYDSFKSGTMDYENGTKKARSFGKKQPSAVHFNGQAKRDALEKLAGNSYVIMDESHNAGGEGSNVSNYLQYITTKAKGLTFLSATFAKRPGNMPIYSLKTAIAKAGVAVDELIDAVKRGGATFQEIMSKALTEAGQMIRRERSMEGVTIDWRGIEDESVIQKQREQYDTIIGLFNEIISFQRTYVDPIVDKLNDDAAEEQGEVEHTPGTRDMGISNTPFASRTYNMVQQVLLSLKAEEAAKRAIEHLKLGRKPVITVANTNEGAADEVSTGEDMEMPDLSVNLKKGLQGTLRITKKDAFGNTVKTEIPFDRLSKEGQNRYREIMDNIENASSSLSLSPIDVIKNELKKAGYKIGELTGRKAEFVYNEDGTVKRVKRQDTDKKKVAADFNNGKLDALILNRSAGTGISLHASTKFKDQRHRIMIVAQAQGDVNDEVQIRGRIDRTGQVLRGMYEYVVSQIPSEQRLLMMLKAKLRSLDANTTSSQKSKFNEMQVQDIINKYGDDVVIQYLAEHPDIAMKMCDPLKWGEGAETLSPEALVAQAQKPSNGGDGATASKVLGRMALLTVREQEKMLQEIGDLYTAEIDRLNEMGENDLEITEMPLRAKTLKKDVWEEGVEPGGKNPFADNSYVEEVEMDVLRKPMKAEEVKKSQARLLGGKTWEEYKQGVLDKVDEWAEQKKAETTQTFTERAEKKANAEKEKYAKGAKKAQEKNGMTDAEIERNAGYQYDTFYKQEMDKLKDATDAVEKQKQAFVDALETFSTDGVYALPTDIYDLSQITFEPSFGKVIDIKIADNFSTAASTISFATLDGRRKITIPISGMVKQQNGEKRDIKPSIVQQTAQARSGFFGSNIANMLKVLGQNVDNWDKLTSTAARKKGYIITGNLLKALTSLRNQGKGGKLISYTTDTGEIRQGILMSDQFDPGALTSKNPISSAKGDLNDWSKDRKIVSSDKEVTIKNDGYRWYKLKVPKSKKKGEKYFNDEVLLSLMEGQFSGSSQMVADFNEDKLDAVLKRLDELGVTVESTKEDNNSQNTLSRNTEIRESAKNDVSLGLRSLKSYTDKNGNYHRGIEEELSELEDRISGAGEESPRVLQEGDGGNGTARSLNDLRKQAATLRAEIARRSQKKQEIRKEYNIDEKGNISLDDLSRMFHDLNSSKILGKLFDKVYSVLKNLGVDFRFTDKLRAKEGGKALSLINVTFYNWDAQTRDLDNQEKARILLHEMIHNVSMQILDRYKNPSFGKLTKAQERLAKEIISIYNKVKSVNPVMENGERPYGLESEHEMIAELANPEFRDILDSIRYRDNMSIWQGIKQWFRKLLGLNTALDSLTKALDDILDGYDENENRIYRQQKEVWNNWMRSEGYKGDYVDFWETGIGKLGRPSIVTDPSEIERLNSEPTEKGYRTVVQNEDGTFGSPMAGKLSGKKGQKSKPTSAYRMNEWERSEENPQLATDNGKINLIKPGGHGTVGNVDYNPYIHIRENKLNKQFKNAWERPNLVYIEVEYPKSEMTSGYRAEKAAKTVGRHKWPGGDLILSRWDKPVRIVPWEEVADDWVKEFKNRGVEFDIVSPHLLPILARRGVKILPPHKNMGEECEKAYQDFMKSQEVVDPMTAIRKAARQFREQRYENADPLEAIRKAAEAFTRSSNVNSGNTPLQQSAKALYNERLNRVETVFSEAYQDAMVSLKTAQNAIAGDKEMPDSQNAYMAENLMHGKNKNEMDLFNRMFRDPLIQTINKIMNLTGMNWGDIDRYVYTKSGLERNREFFVRDWLEAERKKIIKSYEDLNPEEQEIFDRKADTIETLFEDGDIETEEQKEKELEKALQESHNEYVDDIEQRWQAVKRNNFIDLNDGSIDFVDYIAGLDNFIRDNIDENYVGAEHDYSGFRAMYGDEDGKYDEDEIINELMNNEYMMEAENVDTLWNQIRDCTLYGLERYREAGMRTDEQIDRVEQMFHWYVPMRGFKGNMGEDMYQYFTGKDKPKSYVGGLLKHAKGRGSEANYPISTIFSMTYKAISDCNQNLVNQKFYRLCQANPNDLVILSDSWAVLNETTGEWEEVAPDIPEDADEEDVRQITEAWEESMRQLANEGKAKKIKGKEQFDYKPMDKKKQSEHIVDVRINGQPRKMIVTGNPRMAQALNGQLRFENGKNVFSKWNSAIKNFMASVFTSYSPTFALRNMFRDWTHFRTMLGVREGRGYAKQADKYYRQSLFKMVGLFKKYRNGTLDESKEMERDFKDFMDNGGITGFVFMQKIDDIQKEMEDIYKKQKAGKTIRLNNNMWEKILGAVEALNEGIENNARFATFRASRHYAGRTKARSAYDAKEITVNFNRKGAGGKTAGFKSQRKVVEDAAKAFGITSQILGEGRIFFNATVQAIATTFKNFQNADGSLNKPYIAKWAAKYALPPFLFGLALPMINKALAAALGGDDGDDDPYANLPEWTRRKNLCFYIGNGNFITIPIGQELAAFLTLGDIMAGNTYAPDLKPVDRSWDDEILGVMNTFSPVDVDTKITKGGLMEDPISEVTGRTFSVLAPLVAVEQNLGWTGRPIYREDIYPSDKYNPEYQMVYRSTNPVMVGASKLANDLSGGDDVVRGKIQVNPAIVQYLWEQYTGGPGKVFSNTISIGKDAKDILSGNESDFNIRKVEGLKAFVQQGDDRTAYYRTQAKYRKYLDDAKKLKDAVNGYKKAAETDPLAPAKLEKISASEDYVRMERILEADKELSKINKAANKAEGQERRELRRQYNQGVKEVVDELDKVQDIE